MKSKLLPFLALMVFTSMAAYSQIPEVIVGDTQVIAIFSQPYNGSEGVCNSWDFSLKHHVDSEFIYITIWRWPEEQSQLDWGKTDTESAVFAPSKMGIQSDTGTFWSWWHCAPSGHLFDLTDSIQYEFSAKGIDSIVLIKIKDTTLVLPFDSQAGKNKSKIDPLFFYSNIVDSVLFDSWQLVIDPSAKISFTVDTNTISLSEYRSKPFTRKKQLNFTFTSALAATDTAHSFPATMKTRVRYHGVDSIYSNNFMIILPAAPKSGVRSQVDEGISLTINPNPFSKLTTFIVTTPNAEPVMLEIYDILGNRKTVIANKQIITGSRAFGFDASNFAAGSYFVRLVCGDHVVSKKILIY